jgi:hypothetical protein
VVYEPNNCLNTFSVTGVRANSSVIAQAFTPDGLVDGGPGGVVDFQTFSFVGNWTNLVSVMWTHTGSGTTQGIFALDNIGVDQPAAIPEPSTLTLVGLDVLGLLGHGRRCRKRLKALGSMAKQSRAGEHVNGVGL